MNRSNPNDNATARRGRRAMRCFCHRARGLAASNDGAAAVEFALVAPLLVLLVLGLLEFGIFFWNKHSVEFATEETGRVVMTQTTISEDTVAADLKARVSGIKPEDLTATVTKETLGATTFVTIGLNYTYKFFLIGGLLNLDPIQFVAKTRVPLRSTE